MSYFIRPDLWNLKSRQTGNKIFLISTNTITGYMKRNLNQNNTVILFSSRNSFIKHSLMEFWLCSKFINSQNTVVINETIIELKTFGLNSRMAEYLKFIGSYLFIHNKNLLSYINAKSKPQSKKKICKVNAKTYFISKQKLCKCCFISNFFFFLDLGECVSYSRKHFKKDKQKKENLSNLWANLLHSSCLTLLKLVKPCKKSFSIRQILTHNFYTHTVLPI